MPCYYTGSAEGDARLAAGEAQSKLTTTTNMLCEILSNIEQAHGFETNNYFRLVPDTVHAFWKEHKQIDAERVANEEKNDRRAEIRKKALSRLSDAEREALDIRED